MADIRVSVSDDLKVAIKKRTDELGITSSEYLRMLAKLDIYIKKYQNLTTYVNVLYDKINEYHKQLDIYAAPLQVFEPISLNYD